MGSCAGQGIREKEGAIYEADEGKGDRSLMGEEGWALACGMREEKARSAVVEHEGGRRRWRWLSGMGIFCGESAAEGLAGGRKRVITQARRGGGRLADKGMKGLGAVVI